MLLGDIIARLEDEGVALEALLGLENLGLLTRVQAAAAAHGLGLGQFTSRAVRLFSRHATDEDWVSLIGAMGQAEDPGQVCLKRMLEYALSQAEGEHAPRARPGGA